MSRSPVTEEQPRREGRPIFRSLARHCEAWLQQAAAVAVAAHAPMQTKRAL